ncbi:MAG: helix-turn-helix domain-containing protein [Betaproteobacteria bacterium]|nr:helix-turn-helix domain-containing protein [Betaproteobacteria bacterium]
MKDDVIAAVQTRIALVRDQEELTQVQMAALLGITQPRLNALLNNHGELFSLEALIEIAAKLELNVRLSISRPYRDG